MLAFRNWWTVARACTSIRWRRQITRKSWYCTHYCRVPALISQKKGMKVHDRESLDISMLASISTRCWRVKIDGHLRIARACDGTRKSCCCTHYCSVPPVARHTTPNRAMKVNDSRIARYFNPYKHYKSLSSATMTKNGLIVATQYTRRAGSTPQRLIATNSKKR